MSKIVLWPDVRLKIKAKPVESLDDEIRNLLDEILDAINLNKAIGLSGTHIGIDLQLVVVAVNDPIYMVNPEITYFSNEKIISHEGSVSFPAIEVPIERSNSVVVKYLDYNGIEVVKELNGLESICAQHEIDQMNGITILDRLSRLKREFYLKKMMKRC